MKYILYSPSNAKDFFPITESLSTFLLPVLNKPLVEHTIDYLYKEDIKEITIFIRDFPYETRLFLGNGERWGFKINYKILSGEELFSNKQFFSEEDEDLFLFPITHISDFSFKKAMEYISKNSIDFLILNSNETDQEEALDLTTKMCTIERPTFLSKKSISLIKNNSTNNVIDGYNWLLSQPINSKLLQLPNRQKQIKSLQNLLEVNLELLQNPLSTTIFPGIKAEHGLYISPGVKIPENNNTLLLLGKNTEIKGASNLCKNSIIGDNCIIDEGSIIENSLIYENQYIGAHTEIKDCIVYNKYLIKPKDDMITYISEDFIIGNVTDRELQYGKTLEFLHRIIALFLLLLFFPITLFLYILNLFFPKSNKILKKETVPVYTNSMDFEGNRIEEEMELPKFNTGLKILNKLPALWHVVTGKQLLVGTGPKEKTSMLHLVELYNSVKLAPPGIIRIWEAEKQNIVEEKIISELYYTKKRTFRVDMRILIKFFIGV